MEFHPELLRQLDLLSETLGDGTDLHAVLGVLADDLSSLIPTFLGLDLQLSVAGIPVMLRAVSADRDAPVRASLAFSLGAMGMTQSSNSTLVYYASERGAFAELAADLRRIHRCSSNVVLDAHLQPTAGPPSGVVGLGDLGTVNQAVGILVGRDQLTVEQALSALYLSARDASRTLLDVSRNLVCGPPAR